VLNGGYALLGSSFGPLEFPKVRKRLVSPREGQIIAMTAGEERNHLASHGIHPGLDTNVTILACFTNFGLTTPSGSYSRSLRQLIAIVFD
jgi:hypothetical protein